MITKQENEIFEIIENLRKLSGNEQLEYLKSHKENQMLREMLYYCYCPDLKYKINEAKWDKALGGKKNQQRDFNSDLTAEQWNAYKSDLTALDEKKGIKEQDIARLFDRNFSDIGQNVLELFKGILFKDLRIGMSVISFNKVWEDFYFKYPYMGAKGFSLEKVQKMKYPVIQQLKADGMFCNIIVDPINKTVDYVSRQGKPVNIKNTLEGDLLKIKANEKFVLTGEILLWNNETNRPFPRQIANGILKRDNKTEDEKSRVRTMVWDIIPYQYFIQGKWNVPYTQRFELLKNVITQAGERVILIETHETNTPDEAMALFDKMYERGEEGCILKDKNLIWANGKPSGAVKIKAEKECDLEIIGFEEGSGAYKGMCGTLNCASIDRKLIVGVKPRTPLQAQDFWDNQEKYLNTIVAVKYNEKIASKQKKDTMSLFLPVFVESRIGDKDVADKIEEIK